MSEILAGADSQGITDRTGKPSMEPTVDGQLIQDNQ
jgi:hypothetical protein